MLKSILGPLPLKLLGYALAIAMVFFAGWKVRDWQADSDALDMANRQMEMMKARLIERDAITAEEAQKSKTLEELLAAMRESGGRVRVVREKEYVEKNVYRDCVVPNSGVQLINSRIARNRPAPDS
jgi:hypothetical protein